MYCMLSGVSGRVVLDVGLVSISTATLYFTSHLLQLLTAL